MTPIKRVVSCDFTAVLLGISIAVSSGCSHEPTASTSGAIAVTVSTAGANIDLDLDGYTLSVDGGPAQAVWVNASVTIGDLPTGNRLVRLDGVASNCSVAGTNPRPVEVVDYNKAASVSMLFSVSCIAKTGSIRVSTATLGPEPDPDGYSVSVGGVAMGNLGSNAVLEIAPVREGQTEVALTGVSGNCAVDDSNPRRVNVAFSAAAAVAFTIRCVSHESLGPRAFIWTRETGMIALPLPPGATASYANAVNDLGQVVGTVSISNSDHAFVWTLAGGMVDIGGLSGAVRSYATAINNAGQVAGDGVDASGHQLAFRWSPSEGMIALGGLPGSMSSYPRGINSNGQVVGESYGGTLPAGRPFRWSPEKGMEDLGLLDSDAHGGATAISNSGEIVGFSGDGKYYETARAVLWLANGEKRVIYGCATPGFYGCFTSANAINGAGQIAGNSEVHGPSHAFLWTVVGDAQDLGTLPGTNLSYASGINEGGQIVGNSTGGSLPYGHAFLWSSAGGMVDLGVLNGKTSSYATGINKSGQVVGTSQ